MSKITIGVSTGDIASYFGLLIAIWVATSSWRAARSRRSAVKNVHKLAALAVGLLNAHNSLIVLVQRMTLSIVMITCGAITSAVSLADQSIATLMFGGAAGLPSIMVEIVGLVLFTMGLAVLIRTLWPSTFLLMMEKRIHALANQYGPDLEGLDEAQRAVAIAKQTWFHVPRLRLSELF